MATHPVGESRNVALGGAELLAYFFRLKPMVIIGRADLILAGYKLIERRLLLRAAAQHQHKVGHGKIRAKASAIVRGRGRRVSVALESHQMVFVDAIDNPRGGCELLGHCWYAAKQCAGEYKFRERAQRVHRDFLGTLFGKDCK